MRELNKNFKKANQVFCLPGRLILFFKKRKIVRLSRRVRIVLPLNWPIIFATAIIIHFSTLTQIRIHKNLTVEDGMVQSQVNCILQDRQGYMWFATDGRLPLYKKGKVDSINIPSLLKNRC